MIPSKRKAFACIPWIHSAPWKPGQFVCLGSGGARRSPRASTDEHLWSGETGPCLFRPPRRTIRTVGGLHDLHQATGVGRGAGRGRLRGKPAGARARSRSPRSTSTSKGSSRPPEMSGRPTARATTSVISTRSPEEPRRSRDSSPYTRRATTCTPRFDPTSSISRC